MASTTVGRLRAPQRDQRDRDQDAGDRHHAVHHAHQRSVEPAQGAGGEAAQHADGERDERRAQADEERDARAVEDAAVDVAAEGVRAHQEHVLHRLALERGDLARLERPQVAAAGVEQRRVDRASTGASRAIRTRRRREIPPMRTDQLSRIRLIADPRIEEHVGEIDQQVDEHVRDREEKDHPLHRREVAREDRVDREPAKPGEWRRPTRSPRRHQ